MSNHKRSKPYFAFTFNFKLSMLLTTALNFCLPQFKLNAQQDSIFSTTNQTTIVLVNDVITQGFPATKQAAETLLRQPRVHERGYIGFNNNQVARCFADVAVRYIRINNFNSPAQRALVMLQFDPDAIMYGAFSWIPEGSFRRYGSLITTYQSVLAYYASGFAIYYKDSNKALRMLSIAQNLEKGVFTDNDFTSRPQLFSLTEVDRAYLNQVATSLKKVASREAAKLQARPSSKDLNEFVLHRNGMIMTEASLFESLVIPESGVVMPSQLYDNKLSPQDKQALFDKVAKIESAVDKYYIDALLNRDQKSKDRLDITYFVYDPRLNDRAIAGSARIFRLEAKLLAKLKELSISGKQNDKEVVLNYNKYGAYVFAAIEEAIANMRLPNDRPISPGLVISPKRNAPRPNNTFTYGELYQIYGQLVNSGAMSPIESDMPNYRQGSFSPGKRDKIWAETTPGIIFEP